MTPPPPVIEDLETACIRLVSDKLGLSLDGQPETLPILDHYLREVMAADEGQESIRAFVAPCAGAYFGEVLRRSFPGARWTLPDPEAYEGWRLAWPELGLSLNPIGVALEALSQETLAGWHAHLDVPAREQEAVKASLDASVGVREEDFFRLAVRAEVLEQTVRLLTDRKRAREAN